MLIYYERYDIHKHNVYIHTRVYPNVGKTNRSWHHFCSRAFSKKLVHQLAASWLKSRFDDPESIKTSKSWHGTAWAFQMSSHQNVHWISFVFFGFCFIFKLFIFLLRVFHLFHLFHLFCLFCLRRLFHLFRVFCLFRLFRFFHFREAFGKALHNVDSQNHIHQDHCHDSTVHPSLISIWPWRDPWSDRHELSWFPYFEPSCKMKNVGQNSDFSDCFNFSNHKRLQTCSHFMFLCFMDANFSSTSDQLINWTTWRLRKGTQMQ